MAKCLMYFFAFFCLLASANPGLPSHYDLREIPGALQPVKNEGACGGTWAYPSITAMEYAIFREEGISVNLSDAFVIACDTKDGQGCSGGNNAMPFAVTTGVVLSQDFPQSDELNSKMCMQAKIFRKADGWGWVNPQDPGSPASVDAIKAALLKYGPISTVIAMDGSLPNYQGGIYNECSDATYPNHMVSIVGWDDSDGGYWIIRNMWGSAWGEGGYARIRYGCKDLGEDAAYLIYHRKQ